MTRLRPLLLWLALGAAALVLLVLVLPPPGMIRAPAGRASLQILDRHGQLLYEQRKEDFGSHRTLSLAAIPRSVIDAVISIEDRGFTRHPGVSLRSITRALWQNVTAGDIVSGGSTLTQQLVRIRVRPRRRSISYKLGEMALALKLDQWTSKEKILEDYLNEVYFGHQAYGIAAAADTYFGIQPRELSVAQAALLAGIVQSPVALDPFHNMEGARKRQQLVLAAMRDTGAIDEDIYADAVEEPIRLTASRVDIDAPHFVFWTLARRELALAGRTSVRTTIDGGLQREVERIAERHLETLAEKNVTSAAVVVLDAHTGDILAMTGSADYFDTEHEGAVNAATSPRQPGSAVKPFTYALALEQGATAATTVADVETQFLTQSGNPYIPRNYDFGYHGLVRYRDALANSYNIAAVKVLERVGVSSLLSLLQQTGITSLRETPAHYGLALTLGDAEISLLELTRAYGIFPRGGKTLTERMLLDDPVRGGRQVVRPQTAWLISDILSDNGARLPEFGADGPLSFAFPVAAKTGTTRNSRDNWTIGFTPDVLVGVWVGNADNTPMRGTSGVTGAGPIFHDVLLAALRGRPGEEFVKPAGIVQAPICRLSGLRPTRFCPETMDEFFVAGTEAKKDDDLYREFPIDSRNGLLAGAGCEQKFVTARTFAVFPPEVRAWARENGWPEPPIDQSPLCGPAADSHAGERWLAITQPHDGTSFRLDPLIPDDHEQVILTAQAGKEILAIEWFVDGTLIGKGIQPDFRVAWRPTPGIWTIETRAKSDASVTTSQERYALRDQIHIEVIR